MSSSTVSEKPTLAATPDQAARLAGILLLLTAIVTAVMVYARVVSGTDQETLLESSRAVAANQGMCGLFGVARLVSGLTLLAAGWFLLRPGSSGTGGPHRWCPTYSRCPEFVPSHPEPPPW